ncbi:hypothetical protein CEXT_62981 [Caerostris extrusa]|uniref:Uncharacterized protein n=1 Tax=Caerostris extrusa TaxID=172846 RepID=A0AAV4RZ16_CAEEX|nr:hypothetical protein CEXT_62981 [Caerostris extrusa]
MWKINLPIANLLSAGIFPGLLGSDLGFQDQWFRLFPGKLPEKERLLLLMTRALWREGSSVTERVIGSKVIDCRDTVFGMWA